MLLAERSQWVMVQKVKIPLEKRHKQVNMRRHGEQERTKGWPREWKVWWYACQSKVKIKITEKIPENLLQCAPNIADPGFRNTGPSESPTIDSMLQKRVFRNKRRNGQVKPSNLWTRARCSQTTATHRTWTIPNWQITN